MCLVAIAAIAQQKAEIEVSYTEHQPNMRTGEKNGVTHQYILLAGGEDSKFFSPRTEYIDSLNSTPEGKAKYQEMTRSAYLGGKMDDIPRADGSYYVVKNATDNKYTCYDTAGTEKFYYEEEIPQPKWEVRDSTKTILGYECFVATADFHGRKWSVWFTPEIPVVAGPWKLQGVPGLILEAATEDGLYSFVADGIQQPDKNIHPSICPANTVKPTESNSSRPSAVSLTTLSAKSMHSLVDEELPLVMSAIKMVNPWSVSMSHAKPLISSKQITDQNDSKINFMARFSCIVIMFVTLCGCSTRRLANGWYPVADTPDNHIEGKAIVTVKDFDTTRLDTVSYPDVAFIEGRLKVDKVPVWAKATEDRIGKRNGFVFKDSVVMAPSVNCRIESGCFTINSEDKNLILEIYNSLNNKAK